MLALLNSPDAPRVSNDSPAAVTLAEVLPLVAALENRARAEGTERAAWLAGLTSSRDTLNAAKLRTAHARAAVTRAVSALTRGGAR